MSHNYEIILSNDTQNFVVDFFFLFFEGQKWASIQLRMNCTLHSVHCTLSVHGLHSFLCRFYDVYQYDLHVSVALCHVVAGPDIVA